MSKENIIKAAAEYCRGFNLDHYWVAKFAIDQVNVALEDAAFRACLDCFFERHKTRDCRSTVGKEIRVLKVKP